MDACRSCGARLSLEAEWCWQCYTPVAKPISAPLGETPWAGPLVRGLQPDPDPLPPPRYSRWKAGPTTFGPTVKIVITCALLGLGWLLFVSFKIVEGAMAIADVGVYLLGAGYLLRHVWRRGQVG